MRALFAITILLLPSTASAWQDERAPAVQLEELLKDYSTMSGGYRAAETDLQRKQAVEQLDVFPNRFLELAERFPTDPVALPALRQAIQAVQSVDSLAQQSWEMNRNSFALVSQGDSVTRIVSLLMRDHFKSDQLGPICDRLRYGTRPEFAKFLEAVLEENPHRNIQGLACLTLAQLMRNQLYIVERVAARPQWITRYDDILGKEYFQSIRGAGRPQFEARIVALYERAARFEDVANFPYKETVAEKAGTELFDIRHLSIGKLAPDIDGHDQNGERFKLSDYRGKVVLLYFWSEY